VPTLFAATLFVSASLLFMVQPMVGKMVLPLLGGSPAVWNACMVFFQALLLLGYLYAHFVASRYEPKKQWAIHLAVLALPIGAFFLAVLLGTRHSPIAIAESLAPTGESSPVLSVLALLAVAIAIPFFVVSTSAPLLQMWFANTGHPAARDPYFLYSASNVGSMVSLLGYPLFIEPNLSIVGQAWLFAVGFGILAVMVYFCGQAAANPIGVPPPPKRERGKMKGKGAAAVSTNHSAPVSPVSPVPAVPMEPPPTWLRKAKWIALAFVPSSLMLGVTFHMSTDIASIPLMWVIPLALYLVTFIIAFGRMPDWFRIVIGNLAPVMILLLIFVLISGVDPGVGVVLFLHIATFFAVALMCHYELARDRPSPQYLTEFFLLMSVGGMLGGVFNSLVAPLIFAHAYEYKLVLLVSCLMVPRLIDEPEAQNEPSTERPLSEPRSSEDWPIIVAVIVNTLLLIFSLLWLETYRPDHISLGYLFPPIPIDPMKVLYTVLAAVGAGIVWIVVLELFALYKHEPAEFARNTWQSTPSLIRACLLIIANPLVLPWATRALLKTRERLRLYLDVIIPALLGVAFYYFAKLPDDSKDFGNFVNRMNERVGISQQTIVAILIYAIPVMLCFFFVDRPLRFALCAAAILGPTTIREATGGQIHSERSFFGILKVEQNGHYNRLVHGTTLHGTQFNKKFKRHYADDFQMLILNSPWDILAVAGANATYNPREDPLTYYHRSGPVGAMFREVYSRKNGADRTADIAMVGLGTGSVACYAQKGQRFTFYEIDPAVKHLVDDTAEYFSFTSDARARGANIDIRMGDARLKLKGDTDRKYALLLVDAFSSDAIPVHLLTKEAVQLYMNRITEDGILALHISNKFVSLEPVCAAIAADLGLTARLWSDSQERRHPGKTASSWVVLAKDEKTLGTLALPLEKQREEYGTDFRPIGSSRGMPAWTDDYSDVMRVMMIDEVVRLRRFFGLPTYRDARTEE